MIKVVLYIVVVVVIILAIIRVLTPTYIINRF